jgi:hypothetical protein
MCPARTGLRKRPLRVFGRHLTTLEPFLTGAVAGGTLDHTAAKGLADNIRADLRRHRPTREEIPPSPRGR